MVKVHVMLWHCRYLKLTKHNLMTFYPAWYVKIKVNKHMHAKRSVPAWLKFSEDKFEYHNWGKMILEKMENKIKSPVITLSVGCTLFGKATSNIGYHFTKVIWCICLNVEDFSFWKTWLYLTWSMYLSGTCHVIFITS